MKVLQMALHLVMSHSHLKGTINVLFGPPTFDVQYNYAAHYPRNCVHVWWDGRVAHLAFMQESRVCVPSRGLNSKDNVARNFGADHFKFYSNVSWSHYLNAPKSTPAWVDPHTDVDALSIKTARWSLFLFSTVKLGLLGSLQHLMTQ